MDDLSRLTRLTRRLDRLRVRIKNWLAREKTGYPNRLGLIAIMKNEAMNLDEFLGHYLAEGVDRIYLIDNGSTDATQDVLRPWLADGRVKAITLPRPHRQHAHYWTAIRRLGIRRDCQWLMVADLDEFWFCRDGRKLGEALDAFTGFDVIYANWSIFGSSGHVDHPPSIRLGLTMRQPELGGHAATKWICRTSRLRRAANIGIHKIRGSCSSRTVSDNRLFQINHYVIQSEAYFRKVKMSRGDATKPELDSLRDMTYFKRVDDLCTVEDRLLADRVAAREQAQAGD